MEFGTVVEWKIKLGDVVKRGDVVAVVETDKGAIDVECFESGAVEKLVAQPGERVAVGGVLALLSGRESSSPSPLMGEGRGEGGQLYAEQATEPLSPVLPHKGGGGQETIARVKISPAARAHAQKLHVALDALQGTGPGGVITLQDVERASNGASLLREESQREGGKVSAAADEALLSPSLPQKGGGGRASMTDTMRSVIATAMARSKREIPHYYLSLDVDYSATLAWLAKRNAELPIEQRMLPVAPLLRAIVLGLQAFPDFNGYYADSAFHPSQAIHLGVAIAQRGGGLIAPALLDAQGKTLSQLTEQLRDLVNRVRAGRLKNRELSDGTVTLTSLGEGGVDAVFPVIYPPQVAIIGAGTIRERAVVIDGKIEARPIMTLTLAADHRVSNGRSGARLLARIRDFLQTPDTL